MLAQKLQPLIFKIVIPVDDDLLPECRTPEKVAADKRSALSIPRTPKSPSELRKAEEDCAIRYRYHVEAVQARAARESQRAAEAKARRLRAEANTRQRLEHRLSAVVERDALKSEEIKRAAKAKAKLRAQRAAEARQVRRAIQDARDEKLALTAERMEHACRRASKMVQATAVKSAHATRHVQKVVAAKKEQQREEAEVAATRLATKLTAATERRAESIELVMPRAVFSRQEMAKVELAKTQVDRMLKRAELEHSMAAAAYRRATALELRVDKARANLRRVDSRKETRFLMETSAEAETRRVIFSRLNAADVRCKTMLLRKAFKKDMHPVAFEIPLRHPATPPAKLPTTLVERLMNKSIKPPCLTLMEQKAQQKTHVAAKLVAAARARRCAFALRNSILSERAAATRRQRSARLEEAVFERSCRGTALAHHHLLRRAHTARQVNARVQAAAMRRSANTALRHKAFARSALRAVAAAGRRAERLLAVSINEKAATRHIMAASRREDTAARRNAAALKLQVRCLVASLKASALMIQRRRHAHMYSVPYNATRGALHRPLLVDLQQDGDWEVLAPMLLGHISPRRRLQREIKSGTRHTQNEVFEGATAPLRRSPVASRVHVKAAAVCSNDDVLEAEEEEQHEKLGGLISTYHEANAYRSAWVKLTREATANKAKHKKWKKEDGSKAHDADSVNFEIVTDAPNFESLEIVGRPSPGEANERCTIASVDGDEDWQLIDLP